MNPHPVRRLPFLAAALYAASSTLTFPARAFSQGFESLAGMIPMVPTLSEEVGNDAVREQALERLEKLSRTQTMEATVASPSCTAQPTITDFFGVDPEAKKPASGPVDVTLLAKRNPSIQELWSILRSTGIGSAILKKFEPKYGYEVRIVFSDIPESSNTAARAAAQYRPADKTIVIERQREAGAIAFVLLHEMVHALDGDYRRALDKEKQLREGFQQLLDHNIIATTKLPAKTPKARSPKPPPALEELAQQYEVLRQFRDMRVYRAERFAYDASYEAWTELSKLYPAYYQGRGLAGQPVHYSDEWLVKILRIRPKYLEKYRQGACRTVHALDRQNDTRPAGERG